MKGKASNYMKRETKKEILLKAFKKLKTATTNEAINHVFKKDVRSGKVEERGWRFYVHLNKQTVKLKEAGEITNCGSKTGELGREEKVWRYNG